MNERIGASEEAAEALDQGPSSLFRRMKPMTLRGEVYNAKTVREAYHMLLIG